MCASVYACVFVVSCSVPCSQECTTLADVCHLHNLHSPHTQERLRNQQEALEVSRENAAAQREAAQAGAEGEHLDQRQTGKKKVLTFVHQTKWRGN